MALINIVGYEFVLHEREAQFYEQAVARKSIYFKIFREQCEKYPSKVQVLEEFFSLIGMLKRMQFWSMVSNLDVIREGRGKD